MAHVKVWSSSGLLVKSDYMFVRQLACSFLIAEPSLLKCSSFAAFTLKLHFLWGLTLRGSETSEVETRERCFLGRKWRRSRTLKPWIGGTTARNLKVCISTQLSI